MVCIIKLFINIEIEKVKFKIDKDGKFIKNIFIDG